MTCRRLRLPLRLLIAGASALVLGCGADNQKTLQRLGSRKADSTAASAGGKLFVDDSARVARGKRAASDIRLRVRDQDALDQNSVTRPEAGKPVGVKDGGGAPTPWAHGRGRGYRHHKD